MEAIILDINLQLKPSNKVINKDVQTNEKDFSSTLKSIEEKNKKLSNKSNDNIKNENKPIIKNEDNSKVDEEKEPKEKRNTNLNEEVSNIMAYENLLGLLDNKVNTLESKDSIELEIINAIDEYKNIRNALENFNSEEDVNMTFEGAIGATLEEVHNNLDTEIRESSNIPMDKEVTENDYTRVKNYHINSKVDNLISSFEQIKYESTSGFNDLDNELSNNMPNSQEIVNDEFQSSLLSKKNSQEFNLVDEDFNEVPNDIKEKINNEYALSLEKNEFRISDSNFSDLEKGEIAQKKDIINQIVEKVRFDFQSPKNEIKIKLKPEILGEMTMNIEVAKGAITAKIMVDNQRTKEIIEGNLIQLKEEIKDTGLEIKTFEVFVGNDSDFDKHNFNHFNFANSNKRIKIKSSNSKIASGYDELSNNESKKIDLYSEGSLNLLA